MAEEGLHEDFRRVRNPLGGRLVRLRAPEAEDADRLNPMFNDPDVQAGLTVAFPQPARGFHDFLESARRETSQTVFAIETLEGEVVGMCDLRDVELRSRSAGLGIWIGKPYWDRGYGGDAVRTLCRFGFLHMNLQRIELHVYETNPRGIHVYEGIGFRLEGTLRRAQFVAGRYVDVHVMGLLAEDLADD
jgi:RimJ/RimL family protein N-acetyltransferase